MFESSSLSVADGVLTADGTLTIKDTALPVTATGRLAGPVVTLGDVEKIGVDLETKIDRRCGWPRVERTAPEGRLRARRHSHVIVSLELARSDD